MSAIQPYKELKHYIRHLVHLFTIFINACATGSNACMLLTISRQQLRSFSFSNIYISRNLRDFSEVLCFKRAFRAHNVGDSALQRAETLHRHLASLFLISIRTYKSPFELGNTSLSTFTAWRKVRPNTLKSDSIL